jgi:hypothetical protein
MRGIRRRWPPSRQTFRCARAQVASSSKTPPNLVSGSNPLFSTILVFYRHACARLQAAGPTQTSLSYRTMAATATLTRSKADLRCYVTQTTSYQHGDWSPFYSRSSTRCGMRSCFAQVWIYRLQATPPKMQLGKELYLPNEKGRVLISNVVLQR